MLKISEFIFTCVPVEVGVNTFSYFILKSELFLCPLFYFHVSKRT